MDQLDKWRGDFGNQYAGRNPLDEDGIENVAACWRQVLAHVPEPQTILEVGANVGRNLAALARIAQSQLFAIEPNHAAREKLSTLLPPDRIFDGHAGDLPFADRSFDLVFTSGVLIHIPEDALREAYSEIHRTANQWIVTIEYFSPEPVQVVYQGQRDLLWKRDYGTYWLEWFDDVQPVAEGFFWKRTSGLDNLNWWLFRRT